MADTGKGQAVTIGGHRLTLTNLDKVLYPETGTTKAEVIAYYSAIAPFLVPHARNRPVTRKRWVHGVGTADEPGQVFFQKNLDDSTPEWVNRVTIQHTDHSNDYPLVNNEATLVWLAQIAALEVHVPQWRVDAQGRPKNPDRLVIDLDPGEGAGLADCVEVARLAREILRDMGLDPVPVTSGSKGIHLYAVLDGTQTSVEVSEVAHELARAIEADHPDLAVSDMKKSLRRGKVLVDWSQNSAAKTTVCPYSLRGRARPTVAVPRTWRELSSKNLRQLEFDEVLERMKKRVDPLAESATGVADESGIGDHGRAPRGGGRDSEGGHGGAGSAGRADLAGHDRLAVYRSKRDASKTPEPVPAAPTDDSVPDGSPRASHGSSFVIQRHDARALHYDFRLEHDGVLVSWALPKGPPDDPARNHLAVQTEDHPLDYGGFEGTIPHGQYGAGTVEIWDTGTVDLEKWREGAEVIVTLHGQPSGGLGGQPRTFALIHTGAGDDGKQWLIHLMQDQPGEAPTSRGGANGRGRDAGPGGAGRATRTRSVPRPKPMLAILGSEADIDDEHDYAFEMKWDGIRALAEIDGSRVRLFTRNANDVSKAYPEIVETFAGSASTGELLLDGEIVALDRRGRPRFELLQPRMGLVKARDVEAARKTTPVAYMVFDVLSRDGESLVSREYEERRAALGQIMAGMSGGVVHFPPSFTGDLADAIGSSTALGLEGVMAKRRDSGYSVGRRSRAWIKIKHHRTQEVVIGGWRPGKGRRAGQVGSLLLGLPENGSLRYVGRVGTGFSDREVQRITERLASLERTTSPFGDVPRLDAADAHWVTPKLVGEVEFAEWTDTRRLRQPSWRGWRPDKTPDEVRFETS